MLVRQPALCTDTVQRFVESAMVYELKYVQVQELISTVSEETDVAEVHLKVRSADVTCTLLMPLAPAIHHAAHCASLARLTTTKFLIHVHRQTIAS